MNRSRLRSVTCQFTFLFSQEKVRVTLLEENILWVLHVMIPNRYQHHGREVRHGRTNTQFWFETCRAWTVLLSGT